MKKVFVLLLLLMLLPVCVPEELQVHFLDVGQGDCTIVLCDGEEIRVV